MQKVQTTSISGLEWHQHPGNYLNSRPDVLFSNLLSQSPYNCVSWSEDNIIAFTGPEGIYKGADSNNGEMDNLHEKFLHLYNGDKSGSSTDDTFIGQDATNYRPATSRSSVGNIQSVHSDTSAKMSGVPIHADHSSANNVTNTEVIDSATTPIPQSNYWLKRRKVAISCLTHVIFLANPISPAEHTTLSTPHRSRIKQLVFSPKSFGPMLLSADESDCVCIWTMKGNCTNEWQTSNSFSIPQVIALFWIPLCLYTLPTFMDSDNNPAQVQLFKKFTRGLSSTYRQNIPAFISVSANGLIHLIHRKPSGDRWSSINIKLKAGYLSHCDLIFTPSSSEENKELQCAYLAVAGASLPNRIAIHKLEFNFGSPSPPYKTLLQCSLLSMISLPPLGIPQFDVVHLKFDRSALLATDPHALIVVTSNGTECRISRWEIIRHPLTKPKCEETKFIHTSAATTTTTSTSVNSSSAENGSSSSSSSALSGLALLDTQPGSFLISLVECFKNGEILFGYFDGKLEIRKASDLSLVEEKTNILEVNKKMKTDMNESLKRTTGQPYVSPLCVAVSPNQCEFCLVDYQSNLHLFVREHPFFTAHSGEKNSIFLARAMADVFELAIMTGVSYWDILLYFREICSKKHNFLDLVVPCLVQDYENMSEESKDLYYSRFQILISLLLRNFETQMINYTDCQSRLFVDYIYDTFFSCFKQVKTSYGDISSEPQTAIASTESLFEVENGVEKYLLPFTDWVIDFALFFLRNINHYLKSEDKADAQFRQMKPTTSLQCFFILNASYPSLVPCFSLLFDQNFIKQLRILILASIAIRNKAATLDVVYSQKIVHGTIKATDINTFYGEISAASAAIRQHLTKEYTYQYFAQAKTILSGKIMLENILSRVECSPMRNLFQKLDLYPPLLGFLEQNQVQSNIFTLIYEYTKYDNVTIIGGDMFE